MQVSSDVFPERYQDPVRVGHGAMGDVYRAHDELLDRDVAIKLLAQRFAEDPEIRARFAREGLAAARLSAEPGIVTVFDVGEANGRPFIVMELVPGGSLAERLADGPPPVGQALEWLEGAARALDAGHRRGVVHRDVKPGNLLLDAADRVHVADFGVASAAGLESLTMTGTILGTAGYLSPEQAAGGRATPASDRYGLAVVAWELLSGRRPFAAESATAEAAAHVHDPPPSLHGTRADLPWSELDAVFARALAKDPAERPASCAELVDQLRSAFLSASTTTRIVAPAPVAAPSSSRRRRPAVGLVAVALTALLAGGALAVALARRGDETRSTPSTSVQTVRVTRPGTTVTRQVTVTAPTTAPTTSPTTTPPPPPAGVSATSLTDQATALLRAGRYEKAAAKAQQALETLRGTGQLYEAYALYDLGASLAGLGDCKNAKKALDQSQKIQGHRSEIDAAKRACKGH